MGDVAQRGEEVVWMGVHRGLRVSEANRVLDWNWYALFWRGKKVSRTQNV